MLSLNSKRVDTPFRPNNFDLIRLFAALQVVLFHATARLNIHPGLWATPLSLFHGVPIFFVASGFMVSGSYERQRGDWRQYFRNRALRIFPGLWACLLLTLLVTIYMGFRPHRVLDYAWLPAQMAGLIYTPGFLRLFGSGTYNGALWTIPLELQFYIALPFVYLLAENVSKRRNRGIVFAFVCAVLLSVVLAHIVPVIPSGSYEPRFNKLVRYSLLPNVYLFLFGVVLQRYRAYEWRWIAGKGLPWAAVFVLVSFLPFAASPEMNAITMLLLGITTISLAYTAPKLSSVLLKGQDVSYGVYIYHGLIINVLVSVALVGMWRDYFFLLGSTLVIACLSWRYVEQPILQGKKKRTERVLTELIPQSTQVGGQLS